MNIYGTSLASIHSSIDQINVETICQNKYKTTGIIGCWLGGYHKGSTGTDNCIYSWLDGTPFTQNELSFITLSEYCSTEQFMCLYTWNNGKTFILNECTGYNANNNYNVVEEFYPICNAPTIKSSFELILNHKNVNHGLFSSHLLSTGLENENDPNANTYSIIGHFNDNFALKNVYKDEINSKYTFKLVYNYPPHSSSYALIWRQTSWLNEVNITGYEGYGVLNDNTFKGLRLDSSHDNSYFSNSIGI